MINIDYLGLKCGVCGKYFKEDDDVVVCPDCGTPSHRVCYKENQGCPNVDKHGSGFVFEGFDKIKMSAQGVKENKSDENQTNFPASNIGRANTGNTESNVVSVRKEIPCPRCGEFNKTEANYCNRCGVKFVKVPPIPMMNTEGQVTPTNQPTGGFDVPSPPQAVPYSPDPLSGVPADTVFEENVTAADLASFVSINTPYYMRVFDSIKRKKSKFNFSACLFSGIWFLYRKLYKIGSLIFSIEAVIYATRYYITQRYGLDIMNRLMESIGVTADQKANLNFDQYIQMSENMMQLSSFEQLMFIIPSLLFILQIVLMIVCGSIGNKMYYKNCVKRIQSIKEIAKEEELDIKQTAQAIYLSGGVNPFVAGAFSLIYLMLFFN